VLTAFEIRLFLQILLLRLLLHHLLLLFLLLIFFLLLDGLRSFQFLSSLRWIRCLAAEKAEKTVILRDTGSLLDMRFSLFGGLLRRWER
jgi:hypothetical protein